MSEVVAIGYREFLIVCCYRQPSTSDVTLFGQLDMLLDSNTSLSPVICGDFNVHEASWLHSSHTSTAGTAALDFCESRGLHQLVSFSTRQGAILDLILSEHNGTTTQLPNLNTSDHVAIFLSLATSCHPPIITPPPRRVFHWSSAPWHKLSRHFHSIKWNFQGSVDEVTSRFANTICSAMMKFIPLCIPRGSRPTPHSIYNQAIQDYRDKIQEELQHYSTSRRWWSLTNSLTGSTSRSRPATPPAYQLAEFFSSKLSQPADSSPIPTLPDCHISLFSQFRIKVSHVRRILSSLNITKSIGDDNVSPRVLKSCAPALCGPLTALFRKICHNATFPKSWKISRITPVYKKGARSNSTNYRPIAVLP